MSDEKKKPVEKAEIPEFDLESVTATTIRLAQVLADEADALGEMKIEKVKQIQPDKLALIERLEAERKRVREKPELLRKIPAQQKENFKKVEEVFRGILEENHRRLLTAKAVNSKIVEAIAEAVREHVSGAAYNGKGYKQVATATPSVSLNEKI